MAAKKKHLGVPNPCNSKLVRSTAYKYRKACKQPPGITTGSKPYVNQIHHILCEHAILDIEPDPDPSGKKLKFIEDCLCIAKWNINDEPNLIGLPLKWAYMNPDTAATRPVNFCCHDVDHNTADGYTNECKEWLHTNVWNILTAKKSIHDVDVEAIVEQLNKCTERFKKLLAKRGKRNGGTASSYLNRLTEKKWYEPFSMAATPRKRSPGGHHMPKIFEMIS
jgi:hypothetical protein